MGEGIEGTWLCPWGSWEQVAARAWQSLLGLVQHPLSHCVWGLVFLFIYLFILLGIFLVYIFNAIPKLPHTHPSNPLPSHSPFLALAFPCTGAYKACKSNGPSLQWWPTRPSFDTYAARDKSSRVLVSSYCCSTYRVAVPFSSLATFSSSSIGGPVIHPIADCEHPLLCLLGPGIVSQETAISGSFQQNLASVCNGVSIWKLIMGWIPGYGNHKIVHAFVTAPNFVSVTPSMGV
jgi:hypothetical protein